MPLGPSDLEGMKSEQQGPQHVTTSTEDGPLPSEVDKKNDLLKFVQTIKLKQLNSNKHQDVEFQKGDSNATTKSMNISYMAEGSPPFSIEYKPGLSKKQSVYSVSELLKLQNNIPDDVTSNILLTLPKKSFWRLSGRGYHEGKHSHNHGGKDSGSHDKKSSRNRNSRNNGRRNNQNNNGGNLRNPNHDSSKEVSRDELLAMEEELQPTGNSMADFEKWRAQVKELERKKKGLLRSELKQEDSMKATTSLSDFFNFKKEESSAFEELEPSKTSSATPKGSSSRFSSFFSNASISAVSAAQESNKSVPANSHPEPSTQTSSFRLMSLFNKEEKSDNSPVNSPSTPGTPVTSPQEKSQHTQQQPYAIQTSNSPEQSNQFFQSLMTKGKTGTICNEPSGQNGSHPSNSQHQILEKIAYTGPQQVSAPPGLTKANGPSAIVPTVPPSGFPLHFTHPHMIPPMNSQIAMPPPGFQTFAMAPPPGMFSGATINAEQGHQSQGPPSQQSEPLQSQHQPQQQQQRQQQQQQKQSHHQQQLKQQLKQSQHQQQHQQQEQQEHLQHQHQQSEQSHQSAQQQEQLEYRQQHHQQSQQTQPSVQQQSSGNSNKRSQHTVPSQYMPAPGGLPPLQPPIQGNQNQFTRQQSAAFVPYGQKMVPQPPAGFAPYGQNMMPQPPAGFTPYVQKISQPLTGFNPYDQAIPPQLQQQKK
ncbi:Eap1p Ecym_3149 [Eremothecium cymbalariae DBVPG|uniref:Uncharacterized protein n=1 Tax=Eremothecium cymbalariae (strain CBS 270.75 / DBVPG 7215 / KCTC 17166 / NRRL Y-17582) TaxID=931890 RepID=G8JR83_ERECY|nr:Hypothetical protein Ecym_3149 [Eremothecium cymbalariae DBVPG\